MNYRNRTIICKRPLESLKQKHRGIMRALFFLVYFFYLKLCILAHIGGVGVINVIILSRLTCLVVCKHLLKYKSLTPAPMNLKFSMHDFETRRVTCNMSKRLSWPCLKSHYLIEISLKVLKLFNAQFSWAWDLFCL